MNITVNGAAVQLPAPLTLAELVEQRFDSRSGIAVAVDGELAPRSGWGQLELTDGAAVEVLTAVQGG